MKKQNKEEDKESVSEELEDIDSETGIPGEEEEEKKETEDWDTDY